MPDTTEQKLDKLLDQVIIIQEKVSHEALNGGWEKVNAALEDFQVKIDRIDAALNDPTDGAITRLNELASWRSRVDPVLDENTKQNERILKLELQLSLYNKFLYVIGAGVIGLTVNALGGLLLK